MVSRTVEVSRDPAHLCVRDRQLLVLRRQEQPRALPAHPPNLAGSIPLEDLGLLVIDQRDTSLTLSVLTGLAEHGGALVACGPDHLPVGMFLPISRNTALLSRLSAQLEAPKPVVKGLWRAIVAAKLRAQAANIPDPVLRHRLLTLARSVKSADAGNAEAVGAAAYWSALFADCGLPATFRRAAGDRQAMPPNALLDYGYAVLRATIARSLVAAGLLPAIGIQHIGRANPFCLADDLMEPFRPFVDIRVKYLAFAGEVHLNRDTKTELLSVLTQPVEFRGEQGPMMVAIARLVSAFVRVLTREQAQLEVDDFATFPNHRRPPTPTGEQRNPVADSGSAADPDDDPEAAP